MRRRVEEWAWIKNYVGHYKVSTFGRVRSYKQKRGILKQGRKDNGYMVITLHKNAVGRRFYVHHLVLEAFVSPRPPGKECRHFPDRDRSNNCEWNLSWGTRSKNQMDRAVHGTSNRGQRHGMSKLTNKEIKRIRFLLSTGVFQQKEVAEIYNVHPSNISYIHRNKSRRFG